MSIGEEDVKMTLEEKKKYVEENLHKLTKEELDFFKFNFACSTCSLL